MKSFFIIYLRLFFNFTKILLSVKQVIYFKVVLKVK